MKYLLFKLRKRFQSDLIILEITRTGYKAVVNMDPDTFISWKEDFSLRIPESLGRKCKAIIAKLPLLNRYRKPTVLLIHLDEFSAEEKELLVTAFNAAGTKCSADVQLSEEEIERLFGNKTELPEQSNDVIFESDVYAKDSKAVMPFKIVIEESKTAERHTIIVKRITYNMVEGKEYRDENIIFSSFWKE